MSLPARRPRTLPGDHGKTIRRWWRDNVPEHILENQTIAGAARDVSAVSMAHLMRRLRHPKTPPEVKDAIALAMAMKPPRVTVTEPPARAIVGDGSERGLLEAYSVEVGSPVRETGDEDAPVSR